MDNIEKLYQCYEILSEAGDKITEHEDEYKIILKAVKGNSKEKRLASQFIGKFFKHFPSLSEQAIDAQLDLCEDDDVQIRKQAIKDLPNLCKDTKEHSAKLGDTLTQLLILDDVSELQQVHASLIQLIKYDPIGALTGIFSQITSGDEVTREQAFKFIISKVLRLDTKILTKNIEEFIIDEIKKVLGDVTADEFHLCMTILSSTKLGSTITGHNELVNLAMDQAELGADIDPVTIEDEIVERFIQCSTHALPYFSSQIKSTPFVVFVCDKLLPIGTWNMIGITDAEGQTQLRLLKVFAEMCAYCAPLENASNRINNIYIILLKFMPPPKLDDDIANNPPSFQFSHAECLLYALHTLAKQNPDSLLFIKDEEKLKDFRQRLQFLARGTQGYIKKLQEAVKGKTPVELETEENKLKLTALKTTSNISALIRDLFHTPPSFKTDILLSWVDRKNTKIGAKRHAPITFDGINVTNGKSSDGKQAKSSTTEQQRYIPPSGKYSAKVNNYGRASQRQGQTLNSRTIKRRNYRKF